MPETTWIQNAAAGTQISSEREIEELPDDPIQLIQQLQMLATSSGSAPGGAAVTVDGFVTGGSLRLLYRNLGTSAKDRAAIQIGDQTSEAGQRGNQLA